MGVIFSCAFIMQVTLFDFIKRSVAYYSDFRIGESLLMFASGRDKNTINYQNDIATFSEDLPHIMLTIFGVDLCVIDGEGIVQTLNTYSKGKIIVYREGE
jgi:hypothetical protein